MKPKVIIDSENEHIVRYWEAGLGRGSYPTVMFEVIINANYSIYNLEGLIDIFQREIDSARKIMQENRERRRSRADGV